MAEPLGAEERVWRAAGSPRMLAGWWALTGTPMAGDILRTS